MKKPKDPNNVDDLNVIWVSIPALRMELAKLSKDGYAQYPLGEILLIIREIVRNKNGS